MKSSRQLRELRGLLPFSWDDRLEDHPAGTAAMRDFQAAFAWDSASKRKPSTSAGVTPGSSKRSRLLTPLRPPLAHSPAFQTADTPDETLALPQLWAPSPLYQPSLVLQDNRGAVAQDTVSNISSAAGELESASGSRLAAAHIPEQWKTTEQCSTACLQQAGTVCVDSAIADAEAAISDLDENMPLEQHTPCCQAPHSVCRDAMLALQGSRGSNMALCLLPATKAHRARLAPFTLVKSQRQRDTPASNPSRLAQSATPTPAKAELATEAPLTDTSAASRPLQEALTDQNAAKELAASPASSPVAQLAACSLQRCSPMKLRSSRLQLLAQAGGSPPPQGPPLSAAHDCMDSMRPDSGEEDPTLGLKAIKVDPAGVANASSDWQGAVLVSGSLCKASPPMLPAGATDMSEQPVQA
ncbi:hypothetical protein MMC29_001306 [Sticta canariensis]|nr:hypothetical protein [Sticta canariensis]